MSSSDPTLQAAPGAPSDTLIGTPYPSGALDRDRWIKAHRPRASRDDEEPRLRWFTETERDSKGRITSVLTLLLADHECPWKCVFCDLWKGSFVRPVEAGEIVRQIRRGIEEHRDATPAPRASHIKLYNAGSFFDAGAVPVADYPAIAGELRSFERTIVEAHPSLIGPRCWRFRDLLARQPGAGSEVLEVAMGLETVHPLVLEKLNKRVTVAGFARAALALRSEGVPWRAFVLVQPPFQPVQEALEWAVRSAAFAFEHGATAVCLIPTRPGNGALEVLSAQDQFTPPPLKLLEATLAACLEKKMGGRVFADFWDLKVFSSCPHCLEDRRRRLMEMNLTQTILPRIICEHCLDL